MRKILKFEIPIEDEFTLSLPINWGFLSFQVQNQNPIMWVKGDVEEEKKDTTFYIVGTGMDVPGNSYYLGTIQLPPFVWHLFLPNSSIYDTSNNDLGKKIEVTKMQKENKPVIATQSVHRMNLTRFSDSIKDELV